MTRTDLVLHAALALTVVGMMFVVAGVLATGLFLPGAVLIGIGIAGFAAAAVVHATDRRSDPS